MILKIKYWNVINISFQIYYVHNSLRNIFQAYPRDELTNPTAALFPSLQFSTLLNFYPSFNSKPFDNLNEVTIKWWINGVGVFVHFTGNRCWKITIALITLMFLIIHWWVVYGWFTPYQSPVYTAVDYQKLPTVIDN